MNLLLVPHCKGDLTADMLYNIKGNVFKNSISEKSFYGSSIKGGKMGWGLKLGEHPSESSLLPGICV